MAVKLVQEYILCHPPLLKSSVPPYLHKTLTLPQGLQSVDFSGLVCHYLPSGFLFCHKYFCFAISLGISPSPASRCFCPNDWTVQAERPKFESQFHCLLPQCLGPVISSIQPQFTYKSDIKIHQHHHRLAKGIK